MFLVCEPIAWGIEHVPFNAALLKTIRLAFPDEAICFYAEDSHLEQVREQVGHEFAVSIVWKILALPSRHSNFYARLLSDFKSVRFLLNNLNENPRKDVLVITSNAPILWALKYYVRSRHKDKKIQVIIHGDFSTLHRTPRRSLFNPFYYIGSLKTALKISGYEKLQHIVLEKAVRDAILKQLPFLRGSLSVLDHPIPVDKQHIEINNFSSPVQFGFLGRATEKKGFSEYLAVASEISKRFPGQVKFHLIGRMPDKYRRTNFTKLNILSESPTTKRMNRNEYINRLMSLHYVCLFYDKYYESSASGVLLDSIAYGKPIIATQIPILETIQQEFGDIGYLCRNSEIRKTISTIIQNKDADRYQRQVSNIDRVKSSRTPETLAKKYFKLVSCL